MDLLDLISIDSLDSMNLKVYSMGPVLVGTIVPFEFGRSSDCISSVFSVNFQIQWFQTESF